MCFIFWFCFSYCVHFFLSCVCVHVLYFHFSCVSAYLYYSCYVHLFCRSEQSVSSLNICTADPPDWTSDGAHQLFYFFLFLLFIFSTRNVCPEISLVPTIKILLGLSKNDVYQTEIACLVQFKSEIMARNRFWVAEVLAASWTRSTDSKL